MFQIKLLAFGFNKRRSINYIVYAVSNDRMMTWKACRIEGVFVSCFNKTTTSSVRLGAKIRIRDLPNTKLDMNYEAGEPTTALKPSTIRFVIRIFDNGLM